MVAAALLGPAQRVHQLLVAATGLILSFRPSLQRAAVAAEWAIVLPQIETQQQAVLALAVAVQALLETRQALHQAKEIMAALVQTRPDMVLAVAVALGLLEAMAQLPLAVMAGLAQFLIFPAHLLSMLGAAVEERGQIRLPLREQEALVVAVTAIPLLELLELQIPVAVVAGLEPVVEPLLMLLAQAAPASSS